VKRIGELADFPHLLEHLMSVEPDKLGQTPSSSSINNGWKKPESRFDLVVESADPELESSPLALLPTS